MSQEEFFKRYGADPVSIDGDASRWTVEELYQAIKQRLIYELNTDTFGTQHYGRLVDMTKDDNTRALWSELLAAAPKP